MSASHADGPDRDSSSPDDAPEERLPEVPASSESPGTPQPLGAAGAAPDAWEEELRREIERLRAEIVELRESKSVLLGNLRDAERSRSLDVEDVMKSWGTAWDPGFGSAVAGAIRERSPAVPVGQAPAPASTSSLGPASAPALAPAFATGQIGDQEAALAPDPAQTLGVGGERLRSKQHLGPTGAGMSMPTIDRTLAGVAAVVLGIAFGLAGGALMGTEQDLGQGQVAAAGHAEKEVSVRHSSRTGLREQVMGTVKPEGHSKERFGQAVDGVPNGTESPMGGQAIAASAPKQAAGVVEVSAGARAGAGEASGGPSRGDQSTGLDAAKLGARRGNPAWELPLYLADLAPDAFRVRRGIQDTPCAFAERLMDEEHRGEFLPALGPCIGAHGAGGAPVGTHRVAGVDCCAHHAFVERMTQASRNPDAMAGILAEAKVAKQDGEVPPLLRLRAERSALQFLRRLAGTWASAGIDDGSKGHRWTASNSDPTRLRLSSWIRLVETGASYSFEIEIELSDGPRGDLLVAFDWIDANPLGVAIRQRDSALSRK